VFVCLFVSRIMQNNYSADFLYTKFGGKVAHESRKKRLDFVDNPDHVTVGSWLQQD